MLNSAQKLMFLMFFSFLVWNGLTVSNAENIYMVGDDAGWTVGGNLTYRSWASSKTFHVGDTIVFKYNKVYHNVLEVSRADYRSCNTASPISTHASGNDTILIKRMGHHLFICGVPGHCQGGQRVDIRVVVKNTAAPAPLPTSTTFLPTPPTDADFVQPALASPPLGVKLNGATSMMFSKICLVWSLFAIFFCLIFVGNLGL